VAFVAGWTKVRLRSDPVRAAELLDTAIRKCSAAGLTDIARWAAANHAFALAYSGALTRAESVIERWRALGGDGLWNTSYDRGIEQFTIGTIALWRADLPKALQINVELSPMDSVRGGYQPLARVNRVYAATTLADLSAVAAAEASLALIPDENPHGVPWTAYKILCRARICEARGQNSAIPALCDEIGPVNHVPVVCSMMAAVCRRIGEPATALEWLARIDMTRAPSYVRAHALLTRALIAAANGDSGRARELLDQSLALAVPERVMLPYVENRDEVTTSLLTAGVHAGPYREFIAQCLAGRAAIGARPGATASLPHLTLRERELLGLLRSSLELTEIAAALGVSLNTVNSHRRSLYRKIGAKNRRQAVRLADFLLGPS
jgi:LuxR family maltose regulon positive regulatory protein